jgi:esterase/lipase
METKLAADQTSFFQKSNVRRVLICFHGFQVSRTHDFTQFKAFFEENNPKPGFFEVALVSLYDFGDPKTYKPRLMIRRAEEAVESYRKKGYVIYLLAYSFSATIAARLAVEYPEIQKITLVSPTISLLKTGILRGYLKLLRKYLRMKRRLKPRLNDSQKAKVKKEGGMFKLAWAIARIIHQNRHYLKKVSCKVFMLKGQEDELSVGNTFTSIAKETSRAISSTTIYPGGDHVMIINLATGRKAYCDILSFNFHFCFAEE